MSINEDALSDILDSNKDGVVIGNDLNTKNNDSDPELTKIMNLVASGDMEYKALADHNQKLLECTEIGNDIIAKESICRFDAELVRQTFGGLGNGRISLEEFTNTPSQTNFLFIKKYMESYIATEQFNQQNQILNIANKTLEDIKKALERLNSDHIEGLLSEISKMKFNFNSLKEAFQDSKNTILPYGGDFINIILADLKTLDVSKVGIEEDSKKELETIITYLNTTLSNIKIKLFISINTYDSGNVFQDLFLEDTTSVFYLNEFNGETLLDFILNASTEDNIHDLKAFIEDLISNIEKTIDLANKNLDTYENLKKVLSEEDIEIQDLMRKSIIVTNLVISLQSLFLGLDNLFKFYQKNI